MASFRKKATAIFLIFSFLSLFPAFSYAAGQNPIRSKYFTIYYYEGCDLARIANTLNARYFLGADILSGGAKSGDMDSIIANLMDFIYLQVSDILDIHIYSFDAVIKITPDSSEVSAIIEKYSGRSASVPSFYNASENIIYISSADLTLGMFAHEIAHAIICHYFVVAPPAKVQEVLTGYVEYSIRKATGTLSELRR